LPSTAVVGSVAVAAFMLAFLVLRWRKRPHTGVESGRRATMNLRKHPFHALG
jgi:hypothetical protein